MIDKIILLKQLKDLLAAHFNGDIDDIVLFGSQVTGNACEASDYDVLIVLNRDYNREYKKRLLSVVLNLELEYDIFIDTKIISNYELNHTIKGKHPLYGEAISEGLHA